MDVNGIKDKFSTWVRKEEEKEEEELQLGGAEGLGKRGGERDGEKGEGEKGTEGGRGALLQEDGPPQEAVLPSTATFADKKLFCACVILRYSRVGFGRRPPLVHCFVLGPRCLLANSELAVYVARHDRDFPMGHRESPARGKERKKVLTENKREREFPPFFLDFFYQTGEYREIGSIQHSSTPSQRRRSNTVCYAGLCKLFPFLTQT